MDHMNQDQYQILIAILWPIIQEWMKGSELKAFSWISEETKKLNTILSPLVAFLATAGLHLSGSGSADAGWHIALTIPPVATLAHVLGQWAYQHLEYSVGIKQPQLLQAIRDELKIANQQNAAPAVSTVK